MGFDPRSWSTQQGMSGRDRVTGGIEDLIAENAALQRENRQLRRELNSLERRLRRQVHSERQQARNQVHSETSPDQLTATRVQHWGELLAQQRGWNTLNPEVFARPTRT